MKRYNPKEIEPKWQKIWEEQKLFQAVNESDKPRKFIIDMFPYPSGAAMHVGHVRNFTISDVLSQYHRQKGYNVLHTMGWDTFGLPAENFAIKTGVAPAVSTKQNVAMFKSQLKRLGMSYDWDREINTTDPAYYRWTQWIFTKLFESRLAYQKESGQWWCEECKTVLANEQVVNGCCWRHEDLPVIKKNLNQWFFKITDYADRLLEGIDTLDWPEKIKTMQRNWIGRSEGVVYKNKVRDTDHEIESFSAHFEAFTANTFVVIAPDHPRLSELLEGLDNKNDILAQAHEMLMRRDALGQKGSDTLEGIFTGRYAVDAFGDEDLPIWIASYALADYGTGIVLCSAHDDRDFAFAKKYNIRLKPTMVPPDPLEAEKVKHLEYCYNDMTHGLLIEPSEFAGKNAHQNRQVIADYMFKHGYARPQISYKIHDWLISRQRYWGAPIPIIHCSQHGAVPVPEDQLPVILPEVEDYQPKGGSVLASVTEWVNTTCPECGGPAKRETDTMDGYACSSWYFLRYTDPYNDKQAWDPEIADKWMPIDYYCGGDHAVSHLLYARFWSYFFADQGWISEKAKEPVDTLVYNGYILAPDGNKMSKSKGNVVNPDELIDQGYGADALRVYEMFIAPYEQGTSWNTTGVPGCYRFLNRLWTLTQEYVEPVADTVPGNDEVMRAAHKAIKKVSNDLNKLQFNTAVSALMEAVNELYKIKARDGYGARQDWQFALASLVQLTAPFAPHISEELWHDLGQANPSVHTAAWPRYDEKYLASDEITIVVQVNGKVRANIQVATDADKDIIITAAQSDENVATYLGGGIKKTVYVPGKLINFVV